MIDWLDGYEHRPIAGVSGGTQVPGRPRVVLHTTEGGAIEGAVAAYTSTHNLPHFTVDLGAKRKAQHLALSRGATALAHVGPETNNCGVCVQIEIIGFAGGPPNGRPELDFLAQVLREIHDAGVGFVWTAPQFHPYPPENGIQLGHEPWRMSSQEWLDFNGICGHQHIPSGNAHGDPGALDIDYVLASANGQPPQLEEDMAVLWTKVGDSAVWCVSAAGRWHVPNPDCMGALQFSGLVKGAAVEVPASVLDGIPVIGAPVVAPTPPTGTMTPTPGPYSVVFTGTMTPKP